MSFSHFMIDRPVFAVVIAILITLLGAIAYPNLAAAQYPEIVPPTVNVTLTYPGASAETIAETVADPIEEQINGVEDMIYMSSKSTGDGNLQITVTFKLGTDLDKAQELVQNRVTTAQPRLPHGGPVHRHHRAQELAGHPAGGAHVLAGQARSTSSTSPTTSPCRSSSPLLRVPGVGDVSTRAARDYSIRIWIDPDKAAARNLTVDDIVTALRSHNVQIAAGNIGAPPFGKSPSAYQLQVQAEGRLVTPAAVRRHRASSATPRTASPASPTSARVELGAADLHHQRLSRATDKDGKPQTDPPPRSASCSSPAPTRSRPPTA